ncbi:MAG: prephenate dehydrogenase/arogenate dehydrogenase family protein [Candidatus Omnitrophota bacterium]|nr:prephenate dehydrogenase/arogenate dehydrogenase family protein [Candidatus Omnitrophota bacterium]
MKLFNRIGIVGLGLIGGSLGMAIRKNAVGSEIVGVTRKKRTLDAALKLGAIDCGSLDFKILSNCDLIILATPVKTIIELLGQIKPYIKRGAVISDVGSTKFEIVKAAQRTLPKGIDFIGSHPLAGSEKRGIDNATAELFNDSLCILTPAKVNIQANTRKLKLFWKKVGAKVKILEPKTHDRIIAATSHLPHLAAFGLIGSLPESYLGYAGSGLRDTTRIASSDPLLWTEIFLTNRQAILKSIKAFQKQICEFSILIRKKDGRRLFTRIRNIKSKRDKLV